MASSGKGNAGRINIANAQQRWSKSKNSLVTVDIVGRVRAVLSSVQEPVIIESLPISSVAINVLSKIFSAYVRGNAVPGAMRGGSMVGLDGQRISVSKFMLEGPYLSWKGFLCIMR